MAAGEGVGGMSHRGRLPAIAALAVLGLPALVYFWFIHRYALNVLFYDQWSDVRLIEHPTMVLIEHPTVLWTQHNENRMLFPNLIVLFLGATTHLDVVLEEFLSGIMLVGATILFIATHRRRSPNTPLIGYLPVSIIMFSLVQVGSTLWGFQMAWYLVLLALAACLYLLDRPELSAPFLGIAVGLAVVGSFSSIQGLFIWPVGFLLLWHRRRPRRDLAIWIASAVVTMLLYFLGFNFSLTYSNQSNALSHPFAFAKGFFFLLGDVFGGQLYDSTGSGVPGAPHVATGVVVALGMAVFVIAVWTVVVYGLRRDDTGAAPFGVALVCFGLIYALGVANGRTAPAYVELSTGASRYTTFTLVILAGSYLAVVGRPLPRSAHDPDLSAQGASGPTSDSADSHLPQSTSDDDDETIPTRGSGVTVVRAVLVLATCLLAVLGTWTGIAYGRYWRHQQEIMADVTVNLHISSDRLVDRYLYPGGSRWVRTWAPGARSRQLSLFDTPDVTTYTKQGLFPALTAVSTAVVKPAEGAVLAGPQIVDASVSSDGEVRSVEFQITGGTAHRLTVVTGEATSVGWIAAWDTREVPDGTYLLQSVAVGSNNTVARSRGLVVTVRN